MYLCRSEVKKGVIGVGIRSQFPGQRGVSRKGLKRDHRRVGYLSDTYAFER